jgi:hypothetical protein
MTENETELLKLSKKALEKILSSLPQVKLRWDHYKQSDQPHLVTMADFTVSVETPSHNHTLVVECKAQGYPKQLREAVNQLLRFRHRSKGHEYLVVSAPFITAEGAALCEEEHVGYFDLAGNCRLVFGNYFFERRGSPNPFRHDRAATTPNLYAPKSERILRVLFAERSRLWKVVPLAEAAKVSLGTVSIVRTSLLEREWARKSGDGFVLTQPQKLLKDWATVWAQRREKPRTFFTRLTLPEVEKKLTVHARESNVPFALTGTAGAWHRAPMTRNNRTQAYWAGDVDELAMSLDLKPVEAGANVQILEPRDEGVFFGAEAIDGVMVVSVLQLYLDLQRDPARGEEAAEHLWATQLFLPDHAAPK